MSEQITTVSNLNVKHEVGIQGDTLDQLLADELLRDRQIALEEEGVELGVRRYHKQLQDWHIDQVSAKLKSGYVDPDKLMVSKVGKFLVTYYLQQYSAAIEEWKTNVTHGKASRQALQLHMLNELDSDTMALIALSKIIDCLATELTIQRSATKIVEPIIAEINYRRFRDKTPGLEYVMKDYFETIARPSFRVRSLRGIMERQVIERYEMLNKDKISLATLLIDLCIRSTGICKVSLKKVGHNRTVNILEPTPEVAEWMSSTHSRMSLLNPVKMPMVYPPKEWTSVFSGGFLTKKMAEPIIKGGSDTYLEELDNTDMPTVYRAVNLVQSTAWRVNRKVYAVMKDCWETGRELGKLPPRDNLPIPAVPHDIDTNPESKRAWCRLVHPIHAENSRLMSKRMGISNKLWLASKYLDEPKFYYPHNLDWRSRIYPMAGIGSMNPQGDDTGKALLEFAEGKPMGPTGGFWLAVHIANLFGVDKISLEDRVQWVVDNEAELLMCAIDPLQYQMWTTADKPWCALAAIYEWEGYREQGEDYISHAVIAMDGSNNGAQHLSAMGRDSTATVNLVPQDKPQDVYMDVTKLLLEKLTAISEDVQSSEEERSNAEWFLPKVSRKLCKQPVMTLCYGATRRGMAEQLRNSLKEQGLVTGMEPKEIITKTYWLANILFPTIGEVMVAARNIMDWLRTAANITSKNNLPITWSTPAGFQVLQMYHKRTVERYISRINGLRLDIQVRKDTPKVNRAKQAGGISPNFVHSLDASHLMFSICSMADAGISSISMIHDSYGCHACDVDLMSYIIREQFVKLYSGDVLEDFRQQLINQLPEEIGKTIPPIPVKGTLDINLVMESDYFFA